MAGEPRALREWRSGLSVVQGKEDCVQQALSVVLLLSAGGAFGVAGYRLVTARVALAQGGPAWRYWGAPVTATTLHQVDGPVEEGVPCARTECDVPICGLSDVVGYDRGFHDSVTGTWLHQYCALVHLFGPDIAGIVMANLGLNGTRIEDSR